MQPHQRPEEAGADEQQDQGHHDLHDESDRLSPSRLANATLATIMRDMPRHTPRREQATKHRRHDANARGKDECTPVER